MAAATGRQGDVWALETAQNPVFSHKVAPGVDGGELCDGWGFYFVWRSTGPHCQPCAEVTFQRFNALCHCVCVTQACSLHWNVCSDASVKAIFGM